MQVDKVYYAHHMWKYGTPIEEYELSLIRAYFKEWQGINPSTDIAQVDLDKGRDGAAVMQDCLQTVAQCDALVFSSVNGVIGWGIYDEVAKFFEPHPDDPVYYIDHDGVRPIKQQHLELARTYRKDEYAWTAYAHVLEIK